MKTMIAPGLAALTCLLLVGCTPKAQLEVKPIEVKPIHITVDVNVKIQKEVSSAFDYLYGTPVPGSAPAPGSTPAPGTP